MDYATSEVTKYTNLPDEWESEQIEEYLFKTLDLNESDIHYMASDVIPVSEEEYHAKVEPKNPVTVTWEELKEKHPDALLLFRCGNFYEAYFDDAVEMAKTLGLTITEEKNLKTSAFPHHALDTYLPKLIRSGHRIAICESID